MLVQELVNRVEWSAFRGGGGAQANVGKSLLELFSAQTPPDAQRAFAELENVVFAQDDVYEVAEPVVDVLLAGIATRPPAHVQVTALDALFHIARGHAPDDSELAERIQQRAHRGVWLVAGLASEPSIARAAALDLLELLDEPLARLVEESFPPES